jgi:hypothetical protein
MTAFASWMHFIMSEKAIIKNVNSIGERNRWCLREYVFIVTHDKRFQGMRGQCLKIGALSTSQSVCRDIKNVTRASPRDPEAQL